MENQNRVLDVSWGTILKIVASLGALYLLFIIKDLLVWFLFALIISILFNPAINFLQKRHFPRVLATILVYFGLFALFGLLIYQAAPFLFSEVRHFALKVPEYFEQASPYLRGLKISALENFQNFTLTIENIFLQASSNIFSALATFFGGLLAALAIFTIAFFLSIEEKGLERMIELISPRGHKQRILKIWKRSQRKVSLWFGTRILGALFVGITTTIACYALDVKYAFLFGLLAGLSDFIITIGPLIIGAVIAMTIALTSLPKALLFAAIFVLIQQIEERVLTPVLNRKFLHLSPALVLMALLVGSKLWGLMGALLAIPLMGMLFEFVRGVIQTREVEEISNKSNV